MATAAPHTSGGQPPLDRDGRLAVSMPCVGCMYDLKGLAPDGACPECGEAIPHSFGRALLGVITAEDVLIIRNGLTCFQLAWVPFTFFPPIWILLMLSAASRIAHANDRMATILNRPARKLLQLAPAAAVVSLLGLILCVAAWALFDGMHVSPANGVLSDVASVASAGSLVMLIVVMLAMIPAITWYLMVLVEALGLPTLLPRLRLTLRCLIAVTLAPLGFGAMGLVGSLAGMPLYDVAAFPLGLTAVLVVGVTLIRLVRDVSAVDASLNMLEMRLNDVQRELRERAIGAADAVQPQES